MDSEAMEPTIAENAPVVVDTDQRDPEPLSRFDIISFAEPATGELADGILTRRVVGLGGEVVEFRDGNLYIDGTAIGLPDSMHGMSTVADFRFVTRATQLVVLGDNLSDSRDSRDFGPIDGYYGVVLEDH